MENKKTICTYAVLTWGTVSLLLIALDVFPGAEPSALAFMMTKAAGILSFAACFLTARALRRRGLMLDPEEEA